VTAYLQFIEVRVQKAEGFLVTFFRDHLDKPDHLLLAEMKIRMKIGNYITLECLQMI
jgi:hypothetical protein